MDGLEVQDNDLVVNGAGRLIHGEFCRLDCKSTNVEFMSLCNELKCCLLKFAINGVDMVLLDRKLLRSNSLYSGSRHCAFPPYRHQSSSSGSGRYSDSGSKDCHTCGESTRTDSAESSDSDEVEPNYDSYRDTRRWKHEVKPEDANSLFGHHIGESSFNVLNFFTLMLLKFTSFQFNLMVRFFTFPIWLSYVSFMFLMFPFQTLRHIRGYFMKKLFQLWHLSIRKITHKAKKFGCAVFWSSYVCLMLLGLLVTSFLLGGLMISYIVEKPFQTTEDLNFDYAKASPEAFVPLLPSYAFNYHSGAHVDDNAAAEAATQAGVHIIPLNHKLLLTVCLMVPESEYNRKLGMFQVRVEFMSARGKVTASSRYPTMLRFKSKSVRFVQTIIKSAPLIAGFETESQILTIRMNNLSEGLEPTAFLKVILEQRAEFKDGAGAPEIYAASLSLESQLPRLKLLIWKWKKTVFVWASFMVFMTELVLVSVICRPVIMPRGRLYTKKESAGSGMVSWYKTAEIVA